MFVIVKQESFATVSVGILKLLFSVLLLEFRVKGVQVFVHMKVICFGIIFKMLTFFMIVNVLFLSQEILW